MLINNHNMNGPLGYSELNIENFENSNKIEQLRNELSNKKSNKCNKPKHKSKPKQFKPIESNSDYDSDSDSDCAPDHSSDDTHTSPSSDNRPTPQEPFTRDAIGICQTIL